MEDERLRRRREYYRARETAEQRWQRLDRCNRRKYVAWSIHHYLPQSIEHQLTDDHVTSEPIQAFNTSHQSMYQDQLWWSVISTIYHWLDELQTSHCKFLPPLCAKQTSGSTMMIQHLSSSAIWWATSIYYLWAYIWGFLPAMRPIQAHANSANTVGWQSQLSWAWKWYISNQILVGQSELTSCMVMWIDIKADDSKLFVTSFHLDHLVFSNLTI